VFTADVAGHIVGLVRKQRATELLGPLRRLGSRAAVYRSDLLGLALEILADQPLVEAARCLVDFRDGLPPERLDERVVEAFVMLAGGPERDVFGHRQAASARNDPAGLRLAADLAPDLVEAVLRRLLRTPSAVSPLVVPAGTRPPMPDGAASDWERCAAAGAVRRLVATHPAIAGRMTAVLARNLGVDDDDQYGLHPMSEVAHSLAVLLVTGTGEVLAALEVAASAAGEEVRERLFQVLDRARRLLDRRDRWRDPDDPDLGDSRRQECFRVLVEASLARLDGDWGMEVAHDAATLLEELASDEPAWMAGDVSALLGAFLLTVNRLDARPVRSPLAVIDATSPQMEAMEGVSRRQAVHSAALRLLNAVEHIATVDIKGVLASIWAVFQAERETDSELEVAWRILPLLGKLGGKHGAEPGVLRSVLACLHTYLVHTEVALRAAAIGAWTEVARRHPVPSSLQDLLPILTADRYVAVVRSVLRAAQRLTWNDGTRRQLLAYAVSVADATPSSDAETLKAALSAVLALTRRDDSMRAVGELFVLRKAVSLSAWELRYFLHGDWLPASIRTAEMAGLRLAQARDPQINDRFNARDDEELTALLGCGAGLASLPTSDLADAAVELCPEYTLPAAEFAEVAWRAGRPGDAVAIMTAMLDATPDQPVYADRRSLARSIRAAAELDASANNPGRAAAWDRAVEACKALAATVDPEEDGYRYQLVVQMACGLTVRALFAGAEPPSGLPVDGRTAASQPTTLPEASNAVSGRDPASALRLRAERLAKTGESLAGAAQRRTPTAAYVRVLASLCDVAAHLLRFDAAELDASPTDATAHLTAAIRRAVILARQIEDELESGDPIGEPLLAALADVKAITSGEQVGPLVAGWASLPIPLLVVRGPRRRTASPLAAPEPNGTEQRPVAVVLASIDGLLVTGPQVLRPGTVYTLRLEVRTGDWPEWADRLDAELVSHLSEADAQTPTFTWQRPGRGAGARPDAVIGEGTLLLRFGLAAGQPAPPFLIALRFRGEKDGEPIQQQCDVAGHGELRLRPFDASRDSLTQYRVVDERLLELYEGLHAAGYDEGQVQAFCRLLTATCRAGMSMTWEKRYRRGQRVIERQFHDDLYDRLGQDPELGGRIERGSPLALGFLDVRHDEITAELKVERKAPVTRETAPKYMGQPTQYAAADGARLSILCVLDMSPKTSPVGTAENYL
jgi:hypothetical protein